MGEEVSELIHMLNFEKGLYTELERLSLAKRLIIAERDINGLNEITNKEKILCSRLIEAERKEIKAIERISKGLGRDGGRLTVREIAANISDNELKKQLKRLIKEFEGIFIKLRELNEVNKTAIKENLSHANFLTDLIISGRDNRVYNYLGSESCPRQQINIFDQRV